MAKVRSLWEEVKSSLFFVPAVFIAGAALLALAANRLDSLDSIDAAPFLLPTSLAGARTLLASIAGATITVAALVFSMTALTVQLAASQYSPRVLDGFLRDRSQQVVIGIVVGTFTFSLVSLAMMGAGVRESDGVFAAWAATIATVSGIVTVVAIVAFVDHVIRRIRVDDIVRRIAADTAESMHQAFSDVDPQPLTETDLPSDVESVPLRSDRTGWIQLINHRRLVESLPRASVMSLKRSVGSYVVEGDDLATVWPTVPLDAEDLHQLRGWVVIGETRTIRQDPGFGIRQLTDVALRALSPGINDPATAADVVRHLASPLRIALLAGERQRIYRSESGSRLIDPEQHDHADYVRRPMSELRLVCGQQPLVLEAMAEMLGSLRAQVDRAGTTDRTELIDRELAALCALVADADDAGAMESVGAALRRIGSALPAECL